MSFAHRRPRRQGQMGMGTMMLAMRLAQQGLEHIPPVTLFLVGLNSLIFFNPNIVPGLDFGYVEDYCIQGPAVIYGHEIHRLWLSSLYHLSDMHLYYNMVSLIWKGRQLEPHMGSECFAQLIFILAALSSALVVVIGYTLAEMGYPGPFHQCAAGFSAVLFGLKVVLQDIQPGGMRLVFGLPFPVAAQWAYWAELVVIYFLVPGSSFLGHLCGILAGQLYVATGGPALIPMLQAWARPRRRYNDVVGQARHARATPTPTAPPPDAPPQRHEAGHHRRRVPNGVHEGAGWAVDEPEVIEVRDPRADDYDGGRGVGVGRGGPGEVDYDAVRRARMARFGHR